MDIASYFQKTSPGPDTSHPSPSSHPSEADTAWQAVEPVDCLPNGQPVKLTLRRSLIMADVFGAVDPPFPGILSTVLLYLCAHPRETWSVPVTVTPGDVRPLWRSPEHLLETALTWADTALASLSPAEVKNLATRLWLHADETRATPQKKTAATAATKPPAPSRTDTTNGSGSPPEATPAAAILSSTTSHSATSTPPSIAGS